MDWGLSAVIIGLVAFISNMLTDVRVKKLTNSLSELQQKLKPITDELEENDNDSRSVDL